MNALTDADYVDVKLTAAEVLLASHVGCMRNVQSLKKATDRVEPEPRKYWQSNIIGAIGECVIAKYFNIYWSGAVGDWRAKDVGDFEVKTNEQIYKKNVLMVKKGNSPDRKYFLVAGNAFNYRIFGWVDGYDIMSEARWGDPFNNTLSCYHMDATELNAIRDFNLNSGHAD